MNKQLLPKSIDEANRIKNWYEAMKMGYNTLAENKVWELVENKKPLVAAGSWRLRLVLGRDIIGYKARFVAKGF